MKIRFSFSLLNECWLGLKCSLKQMWWYKPVETTYTPQSGLLPTTCEHTLHEKPPSALWWDVGNSVPHLLWPFNIILSAFLCTIPENHSNIHEQCVVISLLGLKHWKVKQLSQGHRMNKRSSNDIRPTYWLLMAMLVISILCSQTDLQTSIKHRMCWHHILIVLITFPVLLWEDRL